MNRICPRWISDFGGPAQTAFDQMSGECRYATNSNDVIFAFDLADNRNIRSPKISRPVIRRQHHGRDRLQRFALLGIRFFVNIVCGKFPFSERIHHRLALRALRVVGDGKSVEFHISVIAFLNE